MVKIDPKEYERAICPYCGTALAAPPEPKRRQESDAITKPPPVGLLIAAGAGALVILVGAVVAYLVLHKNPADLAAATGSGQQNVNDRKTDDGNPPKPQPKVKDPLDPPYALRLSPARKQGDVRQVSLKDGTWSSQFAVVEGDKVEPERRKITTFNLVCLIKTLEVDKDGHETAWEFTIKSIDIKPLPAGKLPPADTVLHAELPEDEDEEQAVLEFSGPAAADLADTVKVLLTRAAGRRLGFWLTPDDDAMFGSPKPVSPKTQWSASENALNTWYGGVSEASWDQAGSKLVQANKTAAVPFAVVEATLQARSKIKDKTPTGVVPVGAATGELSGTITYRLPLKDSQGPTQVQSQLKIVTNDEGKNGVGSQETVEENFTFDIEYVPRKE
jgi:hypothetical protein